MTETADAIIIGAGIMGAATAYHLARRRYGRVTVLERDDICSGSTALASGGIRHQYANPIGIELTHQSIVVYENFEAEFGVDPQFRQHGYLILQQTEEERAVYARSAEVQRAMGVDTQVLGPAEVRARWPYLHAEDLASATFSPRDGFADPYLVTTAIAARARELGAAIRPQHEVTGIRRRGPRAIAVRTPRGELEAPVVIIAAGCWSGLVGRLAGVEIPVVPRRRCKFITAPVSAERIPHETPFIIDHHDGFSIRREGPGIMVGYGRKGEASSFDTTPDWDLVPAVAERAVRRLPALESASVMRAWAGLYEMTPDQMGIISGLPGGDGLYVLAGFSGHGFMHGPIAGQLMAELVADGRAHTVDVSLLDIARFSRGPTPIEVMTFV
ncbi:MAG TPA: FAD-binding oxidoreductase [Candidatus Bathyarchaeia archaeon]|nr:FAD-binding oxidoreductase [Candidatus Bathyarchaeia archaeon]